MKIELYKILATKPTLINSFPQWMLPKKFIEEIRSKKDVAIAEFAGRDSFAAVIEAINTLNISSIVPTIAYTGTEYGDFEITIQRIEQLKEKLKALNVTVYPIIFLGDPSLWHKLCGRFISTHFKEFGEYSPCVGCHLYFHAIRIPLCYILDVKYIIAGERELHDGRIKVNQCKEALDIYCDFLNEFNIELLLPIRYISDGKKIEKILDIKWDEGKEQMMCVLSKNYLDENKNPYYSKEAIKNYLLNFAIRLLKKEIKNYLTKL